MAVRYIGTSISGIASDTKPTPTANEMGVLFVETDTNKLYQWDTDSWNEVNPPTVLVTDNESTSENNLIPFVANAATATGQQSIEMDGDFHYNPGSGTVTATTFSGATSGAVTATSIALNGNITTAAARVWTLMDNNASALSFDAAGKTGILVFDSRNGAERVTMSGDLLVSGDLTVSGTETTVSSTTINVADPLVALATTNTTNAVDIGFYGRYRTNGTNLYTGLVWDAGASKYILFHGNQAAPTTTVNTGGTGHTTSTLIANLEGNVTGNVTGNTSGTAATVTGAAQTAITSLGTLTALQVDNLNVNLNTISATTGAINITPAAGSAIVLDGTINVDAGVVTGATSITSTALVGTLSTVAQTNITSLGTLTALTVDNIAIDGTTIGHTGDTDLLTLASGALTVAGTADINSSVAIGSGGATPLANVGLLIDHDITSGYPRQLVVGNDGSNNSAIVTNGGGNTEYFQVKGNVTINSGVTQTHLTSAAFYEPDITNNGTISGFASTVYIGTAPTEAPQNKNWALYVDAGHAKFDGDLQANSLKIFGNNNVGSSSSYSGSYGAGGIYADSNWGMILTGVGTPAAADFLLEDSTGRDLVRIQRNSGNAINLAVGGVPETDWADNWSVLHLGDQTTLSNYPDVGYFLANNARWDGSNWKYIETDVATNIAITSGQIQFRQVASGTADANITWTYPMTIDSSGNIGVGGLTAPRADMHVLRGLALGNAQSTDTTTGAAASIQIASTNAFNGGSDNSSAPYFDHTAWRIHAEMPGGWGTGTLHFSQASTWATYGNEDVLVLGTSESIFKDTNLTLHATVADTGSWLLFRNDDVSYVGGTATTLPTGIGWNFNHASTRYVEIFVDYDVRASQGLMIHSGYPITMDATTQINFDLAGTREMTMTNVGLGINVVPDSYSQLKVGGTSTGHYNGAVQLQPTLSGNSNSGTGVALLTTVTGVTSDTTHHFGTRIRYTKNTSSSAQLGVRTLYIESPVVNAGTITNSYGLWIDAGTAATNNYAALLGGATTIVPTASGTWLDMGVALPGSGSTTFEGGMRIFASSGTSDRSWALWADANNPRALRIEYSGARGTGFGSGTAGVTVDYTGNVGIGSHATTPAVALEIDQGANTDSVVRILHNDNYYLELDPNLINMYRASGSSADLEIKVSSGGSPGSGAGSILLNALQDIRMQHGGTETFRFTDTGLIGIGGANYGTDGQILTSNGPSAAPAWEDAAAGGLEVGKVIALGWFTSIL